MRHLDSGFGGFGAFVAQGTSGPIKGLLLIIGSKDAEDDGHILGGVEVGATLGGVVADVVKMRRATTDDTADHDDGIVPSGTRHLGGTEGQFYGTRHILHGNVLIALFLEEVKRALKQGPGYLFIPLGANDAYGETIHMGQRMEGAGTLLIL